MIVLVGTGGVAYACTGGGPSGCGKGGHSCPPTVGIAWENPSSAHPSQPSASCTISLSSSLLTVVVHNLAPGTSCAFSALLANVGQKAVTLTESVSISEPPNCRQFAYSDNLPHSPPRLLLSGGTYAVHGSISLSAAAGNVCQGAHAVIVVTITGTESSTCGGHPFAISRAPESVAL